MLVGESFSASVEIGHVEGEFSRKSLTTKIAFKKAVVADDRSTVGMPKRLLVGLRRVKRTG